MPAIWIANNNIHRGRKNPKCFLSGQLFPDIAMAINSRIIAADAPEIISRIGRTIEKGEDIKKLIILMKFPENMITK
jgi:hypothetical protein